MARFVVDVSVPQLVGELTRDQARVVRHIEQECPILDQVVREAKEHIGTPLVVIEVECSAGDMELERGAVAACRRPGVAVRRGDVGHVSRIPGGQNVAPAVRMVAEAIEQVPDLVGAYGSPGCVAELLPVAVDVVALGRELAVPPVEEVFGALLAPGHEPLPLADCLAPSGPTKGDEGSGCQCKLR